MFSTVIRTSTWFFRLGATFFRVTPLWTTFIIISTLVGQISMLASFLLPIKVIMLLGSSSIPAFVPSGMSELDRETLILSLSLLAVVFYFLQIFASRFSDFATDRGVLKLLDSTQKLMLFDNQQELASSSYKKYAMAVASLTFTFLGLTALYLLYPDAVGVIFLFMAFMAALAFMAWTLSEKAQKNISQNLPSLFASTTGIGFLVLFFYIILDFLYLTPPPFLYALITIILFRQLRVRANITLRHIFALSKSMAKINALFFKEHVFNPVTSSKDKSKVWRLTENCENQVWLQKVLRAHHLSSEKAQISWVQSGLKDIVFLTVTSPDGPELLIKLFGERRYSVALHEAKLLLDAPASIPSAKLCLTTVVDGCHCHVFSIKGLNPDTDTNPEELQADASQKLLAFLPTEEMVHTYSRSRKTLAQRLNAKMFDRLALIASPEEQQLIRRVKQNLPDIIRIINQVPLSLKTPVSRPFLMQLNDNPTSAVLIHFGSWRLEPTGANWQTLPGALQRMIESIELASKNRSSLAKVPSHHFEIVALVSQLEKDFENQRYRDTLALWQRVLDTRCSD